MQTYFHILAITNQSDQALLKDNWRFISSGQLNCIEIEVEIEIEIEIEMRLNPLCSSLEH